MDYPLPSWVDSLTLSKAAVFSWGQILEADVRAISPGSLKEDLRGAALYSPETLWSVNWMKQKWHKGIFDYTILFPHPIFQCPILLKDRHFCLLVFKGRPVRSDLANYSDNFLFIISHSREPLWTIKPVNLGLHINQWNIIASCCLWAWGTLYMPVYIQLASRFSQGHLSIQRENEHCSNWENGHLGSFSCWRWLGTLITELSCFVFHYPSEAFLGKKLFGTHNILACLGWGRWTTRGRKIKF